MNKKQFLKKMKKSLSSMEKIERNKTLLYFEEIIDDIVDSGKSEEEAIYSLGNINNISCNLLKEYEKTNKPNSKLKLFSRKFTTLQLFILMLLSPIILPLVFAIVTLLFTFFLLSIGMIVLGIVSILLNFYYNFNNLAYMIGSFGGYLIIIGLGILLNQFIIFTFKKFKKGV